METDVPGPGEPPLAKISGIQFGLLSSQDILWLSVYEPANDVKKPKELSDPKLGLPLAAGRCGTCNAETVDHCQGHFAHSRLPVPIFHPNHVGKLVALLRKVCLNCGKPKKKRARKMFFPVEKKAAEQLVLTPKKRPNAARKPRTPVAVEYDNQDDTESLSHQNYKHKRKYAEMFIDQEAQAEKESSESVIVLSSDDEDLSSSTWKQQRVLSEDDDDHPEKASNSSARRSWNFRKRKSPTDSTENNSTAGSFIDLTHVEMWNPLSVAKGGKKRKIGKKKDSQSGVVVVEDMFLSTPREEDAASEGICVYCRGTSSERYPEVHLKVEVKDKEDSSKAIKMELDAKQDLNNVSTDYWKFVEGNSAKRSVLVKRSRMLLPSEALKILRKIPEAALADLGMDKDVARPEALIVETLPVPPNCLRIQDDAFGSTNIGFKQGIDRATAIFSKLLNKISLIAKARHGRPTFQAAAAESRELQSLFGLYLREKGAAKAVPGKEKKRLDHVGRIQKRDSRWSLEWLKTHVLGKRSGYSARNVVTGDPFLRVEEIGIPQEVAKYVTIPERVNKLNQAELQECVELGQQLVGRYRACGAVRLLRGSERLEVTRKTSHQLQLGDIVHRHLKDGDLVYINRPPSLHKHSLLALRAHIQDLSVFTINPAICAPLHADFDGDCLHLFVPQSEESKAELHQLMTIPAQLLPSPDGKTIIGMSQDNILAAHLMTSTPVFLNKEMMFQMAMWSTRRLPVPTIVKAPGGPLWAGKQVIDMTIPSEFSFKSDDGAVVIDNGELVSYGGKGNWLTSTNGLMRALAQHCSLAAVKHLDCSQAALREWLLSRGFSVSLRDFYCAADHKSRRKMIEKLIKSVDDEQKLAVNKELIFDEEYQKLDVFQSNLYKTVVEESKQGKVLEDIAVGYFQQQFSEIGEELGSSIGSDNHLLAMVRSGSKGSLSKVLQQIGCLGLQLYKGEHLLSLFGNQKLLSLASSMRCEEKWEARGLVKNSLLDGLDSLEFYLHAIAVRAGILRQTLEVTEPGELFKKLMLFLRDIHVSYDGTVRNKFGFHIIQFSYEGVKNPNCNGDSSQSQKEFVMPGEAVGILAATAIAQPAYQVMLEANHNVGSKKIRPLALLQDTIFPRSGTKLKVSDRRAILRLKPCSCDVKHCEERRALQIKDELQPVAVQTLATAIAIQYVPESSEEWDACRADGVKLQYPWVGHIQFDKKVVIENNVSLQRVVTLLETIFKSKAYSNVLARGYLGNPKFYVRNVCDCNGALGTGNEFGPCLHFSASLRARNSKRMATRSNKKLVEFVDALRDVMVPLILKTIVKGDERIESAKLVWEDAAWSPPGVSDHGRHIPANPDGELVVEVTVQEKLCTRRGAPWNIIKETCGILDAIDWRRSAPYSVQEVWHALGVEAARDCILQRLTLATNAAGTSVNMMHLKVVADLMVHSGEVNGITPFGYRDQLHSLKTSAPFTAGAFRAPIKTFMEAGEKGEEEILSGVLASSIFGKRVPVGTGSDFTLQLQPMANSGYLKLPVQSRDIMDCLAELNKTIGVEVEEAPQNANVETGNTSISMVDRTEAEGGWGFNSSVAEEPNRWGSPPSKSTDARGWDDSPPRESTDARGWGDSPPQKSTDAQGWGDSSPTKITDDQGWGDELPPVNVTSGWDKEPSKDPVSNGWGSTPSHVPQAKNIKESPSQGEANEWGRVEENVRASDTTWVSSPSVQATGGDDLPLRPSPSAQATGWDDVPMKPSEENGWSSPAQGASASPHLDTPNGWDGGTKEDPWASHESVEDPWGARDSVMSERSARPKRRDEAGRRDEPREFRPTGANTIPLGKVRNFGPRVGDAGLTIMNASPALDPGVAVDSDVKSRMDGEIEVSNWGEEGDKLETSWGSPQLEDQTSEWGEKEVTADWSLASGQGGSETCWNDIDDQGMRDTPSGWSSPPGVVKASAGAFSSPSGHWDPGLSPSGDHHGRTSGGRDVPSDGGFMTSRREPSKRPNELLKDSKDWKEILNLVRAVRDILQNYEPEQKLKKEDHHMLMSQIFVHHPSFVSKVGCGVKFFKVAYHGATQSYKPTKCFFLVRTDGTQDDFSYHKCLQTLASKKKPPLNDLYASAFIFRRNSPMDTRFL